MNRPWLIWSVLAGCALLILGMMGWLTQRSLAAEQERADARVQADYSERIRLALSRMDTIGTNLLVVENQRPPLHYQAFFSPEDVFTTQLENINPATVLQPSPLLTEESDYVRLHFEFRKIGGLKSPQVPTQAQRDLALGAGIAEESLDRAQADLTKLGAVLSQDQRFQLAQVALHCSLPKGWAAENAWIDANQAIQTTAPQLKAYEEKLNKRERKGRSQVVKKAVAQANDRSANFNGFKSKSRIATKSKLRGGTKSKSRSKKAPVAVAKVDQYANVIKESELSDVARLLDKPLSPPAEQLAGLTPFQSLWIDDVLVLVREVRGSRSTKYQGVWLDHEALMQEFQNELPEDLSGVNILPAKEDEEDSFALVSLPWKLSPGAPPLAQLPSWTPMRKTILMGWIGALVALAALALLLRGVLQLSERRAAFVSSVTHELRTPLTTFRLYSEMLADGMVPDEATRQEYLRTMQGESERLNHLVENVLSYSQVERGTARSKFEKLAVADLVERLRPVLQRRVDQEDAVLSIEIDPAVGEVETDVTAVEQIIFNLIDNACKYGLPENGSGHISLLVRRDKKRLAFEVCDQGKGIRASERKRLFRAFHKSARDAAHSKPGVGLGLALCRRLATALGGSLTIAKPVKGACFVLTLPQT